MSSFLVVPENRTLRAVVPDLIIIIVVEPLCLCGKMLEVERGIMGKKRVAGSDSIG